MRSGCVVVLSCVVLALSVAATVANSYGGGYGGGYSGGGYGYGGYGSYGGYSMYGKSQSGRGKALYIPYPVPVPQNVGGGAAAAPVLPLSAGLDGFGVDDDGLFGGDNSIIGLLVGAFILLSLFSSSSTSIFG